MRIVRSHRLDFCMLLIQLFQCSTASQRGAEPNCPERNLGTTQPGKVQRMPALRRGNSFHGAEVLLQQLSYLRAPKVIYANLQDRALGRFEAKGAGSSLFQPSVTSSVMPCRQSLRPRSWP